VSSTPNHVAPYFSLQRISKRLVLLLIVQIFISLILIPVDYYNSDLLYKTSTTDEEENTLLIIGLLYILRAAISVAGWVVFFYWFYRAYKNLPALGANALKFTPRRVIVYFFIPIINLWKPYSAAKEIWNNSDPNALLSTEQEGHRMQTSEIVIFWWITSLISSFLFIFATTGSNIINSAAAILTIASEILLILLVKKVSSKQETKNKMMYR